MNIAPPKMPPYTIAPGMYTNIASVKTPYQQMKLIYPIEFNINNMFVLNSRDTVSLLDDKVTVVRDAYVFTITSNEETARLKKIEFERMQMFLEYQSKSITKEDLEKQLISDTYSKAFYKKMIEPIKYPSMISKWRSMLKGGK